ncbi:MAG: hypothetical protein R3E91_02025 [Chlamydiales bacterium]
MLHFFRKHQKYFFIFTTIIIVTSFLFFGTYQAFAPGLGENKGNEIVFYTPNGKGIKSAHFSHMIDFLNREDWMESFKFFDGNYLNDGLISKDFLEGGLAMCLFTRCKEEYQKDLEIRLMKERDYQPYQHPYISSLSVLKIWSLFASEIPEKLNLLQTAVDPLNSFQNRMDLFLSEKCFPPAFLTNLLRYQEKECLRKSADPRLTKDPITLFNYHDLKDWFGEKFVEHIAKVVIQIAEIARNEGYFVSRDELLADILVKNQKTYDAISANLDLPIKTSQELLEIYLHHKGLDESAILDIWEDISLFRRMMQAIQSTLLVDPLIFEQFYHSANESVVLELYQMASDYRFNSHESKEIFATYLEAIRPDSLNHGLPESYASIETIERRAPEIVGKRYPLSVGYIDKNLLQAKVSIKETWDWELANWDQITTYFPELKSIKGTPFEVLDRIEDRKKIDIYAAAQIVEAHPDWLEEALIEAPMKKMDIFLSPAGKGEFLPGLSDRSAFQELLDQKEEIIGYTQDQKYYYRILVKAHPETKEILPFKEAKQFLSRSPLRNEISFASYLEKYREMAGSGIWEIEKKEITVSRAQPLFIKFDEVIGVKDGEFSPVFSDKKEGVYCFRPKKIPIDNNIRIEKWIGVQEILTKEIKIKFFESLLNQICLMN